MAESYGHTLREIRIFDVAHPERGKICTAELRPETGELSIIPPVTGASTETIDADGLRYVRDTIATDKKAKSVTALIRDAGVLRTMIDVFGEDSISIIGSEENQAKASPNPALKIEDGIIAVLFYLVPRQEDTSTS
jgi:hypothetical protein